MLEACSQTECISDPEDGDGDADKDAHHEERPEYLMSSKRVTAVARRELAVAIRDLMQHGMMQVCARGTEGGSRHVLVIMVQENCLVMY